MILLADPARNPLFGLAPEGENASPRLGPDAGLHHSRSILTPEMLRGIERLARVDIYCQGEDGGFYRPVVGW